MTAIDKGTHDQWKRGLRERCTDDAAYIFVLRPPDCIGLSQWIDYLLTLETLLATEYKDCTGMVAADGRVFVKGGKDGMERIGTGNGKK